MFIELMIQSSNHTKVISKNTYHISRKPEKICLRHYRREENTKLLFDLVHR